MAIKKPIDMDFSNKTFMLVLSGLPGIGKTTLALSAPDPFLFDLDKGIARVRAEHRKDASESDTYEEMLKDFDSNEYRTCKTVVIDTGGSLIQLMKPWAKKQDARAVKNGQAMFGVIKQEFDRLCYQIRSIDKKNLIVIFHTTETQKNDVITTRLSCEGSSKDIVWTPADFGCYMHVVGKDRILGFSPTEEYFAKGCFGINGLIKVPELKDGQANDFLTKLFATAQSNINIEAIEYTYNKGLYDKAMDIGVTAINAIDSPTAALEATNTIKSIQHGLTSKEELQNIMKNKLDKVGLKWNKEAKRFEKV